MLRSIIVGLVSFAAVSARADTTAQSLPFSQNWANTTLITSNDNWSGVPGISGYFGNDLTSATGTDPQTIVADGSATTVDITANQTNPNTFTAGGVTEFELTDPTVAMQGSGSADAPHLVIAVNTTGVARVQVSYDLRDIDGSADDAVQPVALQYRVGSSGDFTNVPSAFVADATTGPSLATLVTPVTAVLPAAAGNQARVELRIITTNAVGNDELVGIDNIVVAVAPTPPVGVGAANPAEGDPGDATQLTATIVPGADPVSTGLTVTCDLTPIGGAAAAALLDDGAHGDGAAGDLVFGLSANVAAGTTSGLKALDCLVGDAEGRESSFTIDYEVAAVCGDDLATGSETCDGADLNGGTCAGQGFDDGVLTCNGTCDGFVTTACVYTCGNNSADGAEICDGSDLDGRTCANEGYDNPAGLACSPGCDAYVTTGCAPTCDGNRVEPGETCDEGPVDTATCDGDCTTITCGDGRCNAAAGEDEDTCVADCAPVCGDDFAAGSEACDGTDLRGYDCTDFGYSDLDGLACAAGCDAFVTTGCAPTCDGALLEPTEVCDHTLLGGVDCTDFGYSNGAGLGCAANCEDYDLTGCAPTCDNALLEPDELCDGTLLGGADCTDFGFVAPDGLVCSATCTFDLAGCTGICGNNVVEPDETCDDGGETASCDGDCTAVACGDGYCNATVGEDLDSCLLDCAPTDYFKVAIVGYNADDPDQFSFLALTPLPAGLVLGFTDRGWLAAGGFRPGEGTLTWTADVSIAAGTEITVTPTGTPNTSHGVLTSDGSFGLATGGDQLFAFRGDPAAPELLFGLQMNGDWNADAIDPNTSALPPGLTDGVNALALSPEVDNAAYACGVTTGNAESLSILISTPANWVTDDATPLTLPPACSFDVQAGDVCGDTVVTGAETCDGADTGDATCVTQGFDAGTLGCSGTCDGLDTTGCTYTCGNDIIGGAEVCDGTALGGDDCTDYGFSAPDGLACAGDCSAIVTSGCSPTCGDSVIEPGEDCDNGGTEAADCDLDCTTPTCGDGSCNALAGETPTGCPADCGPICGDGVVGTGEACDDGDTDSGDGCSSACAVEAGWLCTGAPSVCVRDQDGDTVPDATDNCPAVANTAQTDSDGDGVGDACESPYTPPPSGPSTGEGCGCAASSTGGAWAGLALGAVLLALRRRRRAA